MAIFRSPHGFLDTDTPVATDVTIITFADSPYTILERDHTVMCDTADGVIVVNLIPGQRGRGYRLVNTGAVANRVQLNPSGADLLLGLNTSIDLLDGDAVIIEFGTAATGWW